MKVSLNWAQYYSDTDLKSLNTEDLVTLATERLGGVEGFDDLAKHYQGIVVAKVVSCQPHPNADKLQLCQVDDGGMVKDVARNESGYVQVVCGAPNVAEGLLVAWIPPASVVPASYGAKELFVLEARDLRGEISNGMLASPRELGLNDDHTGILAIKEDVQPGAAFTDLYDLDDLILEVENKMFTHRPDCFGQLGVARELAGIQHKAFTSPDWYTVSISQPTIDSQLLSLTNEVSELCPRYMAVMIDNITIQPSPLWLQSYLHRVGVRPINNVVDITNYIMLLTAQPLHAFDFDKIAQNGKVDITVRKPRQGEKLTLLDGKEITPHNEAVLICNSERPLALGGVMGGKDSEVDESTKRIVLECATFDMYNIRKTSMVHGLFTDAVTRFTKGQPPAQLPAVLAKATEMFQEFSGASAASASVDSNTQTAPSQTVTVSTDFINRRLGSSFSAAEISTLLTNVEFQVTSEAENLKVSVPFWRTDIAIAEDIVEEVGRLHGFNRLPLELPSRTIAPVTPDARLDLKYYLRQTLSRAGANEVLSYSFVHGALLQKAGQDLSHAYALRNALSPDLEYYRLSLLPSLLDRVHPNIKAGYEQFSLFELGKVHYKGEMDETEPEVPNEDDHIAGVIAYGKKAAPSGSPYYAARRYLAEIAPELVDNLVAMSDFDLASDEWGRQLTAPYEPSRSALILKDNQIWGVVGEFRQAVQAAFKLPTYAAGFEAHLEVLRQPTVSYRPLSRYPSSNQDITLRVPAAVSFAQLADCLRTYLQTTQYQWQLTPLNTYQKEPTFKNLSFNVSLTHLERTLTTHEVNQLVEALAWQAHEAVGAEHV